MSYIEIDPYDVVWTDHGPEHADPRMVFEDTRCAKCGKVAGPHLGYDQDTGGDRAEWATCFTGPLGIVCEDCVEELESAEGEPT